MAYETRHIRRQKVRYNSSNSATPLRYQLVRDGAKLTPGSAGIDIYAPGSATAVVSGGSPTISGTLMTYALDTTTVASFPVGTGYRAHFTAVVSGTPYEDDVIFDVARYLLELNVGRDQLVALDDRVASMEHDGDEDFSELIEAVRDELQLQIESKVIGDGRLLEGMVLDASRVAIAARYRILAQLFESKRDFETADRYTTTFESLWRVVLSTIQYDKDQDLSEDGRLGGLQVMRLRY